MKSVLMVILIAAPIYGQTFHGLGFSSKTCIDLDGDGYGTGPLANLVTTAAAPVTAGVRTVSMSATTGLVPGQRVRYDTGPNLEFVILTAVSGSTITGTFGSSHAAGVTVSAGTIGDGSIWFPGYATDDPGCMGLDADDRDGTVQTAAQGIAKYGSLTAFLAKLGSDWQTLESDSAADVNGNAGQAVAAAALLINPAHIYYVAPASASSGCTGTSAQCTGQAYPAHNCTSINSPCLTILDLLGAGYSNSGLGGDLIIARDGWNNNFTAITSWSGSPSRYNGLWSYPGEHAVVSNVIHLGAPNSCTGTPSSQSNYIWIDGMRLKSTSTHFGGSIAGGSCPATSGQNHDIVITHNHGTESDPGGLAPLTGFNHIDNWTIAYNVLHDDNCPSNCNTPHGFYMGGNQGPSSNTTIRRNLIFRNSWNGLHWNGQATGFFIDQNVVYDNGITGLDFEMGLSHSFIRGNQSFNNAKQMILYNYPGSCPTQSGYVPSTLVICPGDENYNLIENNTFYATGNANMPNAGSEPDSGCPTGFSYCAHPAIEISNATNPLTGDLGHNTFRNNIIVAYGWNGAKPGVAFGDPTSNGTCGTACQGWAHTSTFDHNLFWQSDGLGGSSVLLMGANRYTCSSAATVTAAFTNCNVADPQFAADAISHWNVESYFDFRLLPASPALRAGSITGIPNFDAVGNTYASNPSLGALESSSPAPPAGTPNLPVVSLTSPSASGTISGTVSVTATATPAGTASIATVQFQLDGSNLGSALTTAPYSSSWNTTTAVNGTHSLTATATDSMGNAASSSPLIVTVNNASAAPGPTISGVTAGSITASAATISWTTNTASDSQMSYGTTTAYGLTSSLATSQVTAHVVTISSLSPSTTYHYQVFSRDGQGNLASSADFSFATAASSSSLGWQDLGPATILKGAPHGGSATGNLVDCAGSAPPAYCATGTAGASFAFKTLEQYTVAAQSGCAVDTVHKHMYCTGGGHGDYIGNQVYDVDLVAKRITRLTDPSPVQSASTINPDGTAPSSHTQQGLVYLANEDAVFVWALGVGPAPVVQNFGWWITNLRTSPTWTQKASLPTSSTYYVVSGGTGCTTGLQTVSFSGGTGGTGYVYVSGGSPAGNVYLTAGGSGYSVKPTSGTVSTCTGTVTFSGGFLSGGAISNAAFSQAGGNCFLDTSSATESVLCVDYGTYALYRYTPSLDTGPGSTPYTNLSGINGAEIVAGATCREDPFLKIIYCAGLSEGFGFSSGIYSIPLTGAGAYKATNITSSTSGCAGLYSATNPGLAFDDSTGLMVGYVGSGNAITLFDPVSLTCVTRTFSGGPTSGYYPTESGTYDRFAYIPSLNQFFIMNNSTTDMFSLNLDGANRCDLNNDGVVNVSDVQLAINQALGISACGTGSLITPGSCTVVDVQRVIAAALGGACVTGR